MPDESEPFEKVRGLPEPGTAHLARDGGHRALDGPVDLFVLEGLPRGNGLKSADTMLRMIAGISRREGIRQSGGVNSGEPPSVRAALCASPTADQPPSSTRA
ncbi:hypothetical protein [Streptomyces mutabilis]|uniref:Uncharacterized protein n=1 Tax=Streptomyces mutabilis TaxID=67332 RepID=A0A086MRF6_9ACTN|nr:hypothetical protein [Streptomyces mutabilis]KFG71474.1 hypothetical protein FM21_35040 [Streptomyces mutabilis]